MTATDRLRPSLALVAAALVGCSLAERLSEHDAVLAFPFVSDYGQDAVRDVAGEHVAALRSRPEFPVQPAVWEGDRETWPLAACDPCAEWPELTLEALLDEVFHAHPALAAVEARWLALVHLYPQAVAMPDPQLRFLTGVQLDVASNGSLNDFRQRYQVQQILPFFGKRRLRGEIALATARIAGQDVAHEQVLLAASVKAAFFAWQAALEQLAIHEEERRLHDEVHARLRQLVEQGRAPPSVLAQAGREAAELDRHARRLQRQERAARAEINALLLRPAAEPLPPLRRVEAVAALPAPDVLCELARANRPDVLAAAERVTLADAHRDLAWREFFPDFTAVARFDSIDRQEGEDYLRTQAGFNVNVPLNLARRHAAVREAEARLAQARAEQAHVQMGVLAELQGLFDELRELHEELRRLPRVTPAGTPGHTVPAVLGGRDTQHVPRHASEPSQPPEHMSLEQLAAAQVRIQQRAESSRLLNEYYQKVSLLERLVGVPLLREASIAADMTNDEIRMTNEARISQHE